MRECVLVKIGGGLITDKHQLCCADEEKIDSVIQAISFVHKRGVDVILVHGAGSFGHLKAKTWKLHLGEQTGFHPDNNFDHLRSQQDAVWSVRQDMLSLNAIICSAMIRYDLVPQVHVAHEFITGCGCDFEGDLISRLTGRFHGRKIDILFGDVVDCLDERRFGILSGDDLMLRIASEVNEISRVVFAIDGVDGLLSVPPRDNEPQQLIPIWREGDPFTGEHHEQIDVTGGIFLKLTRSAQIISKKPNISVILIRGEKDRIIQSCLGENCLGTRILP